LQHTNPQIRKVRVEGHTDDRGAARHNLDLSRRRAESVRAHLVERHGIDASRLSAEGYGESRPLARGKSAKARAKNRRVELVIVPVIEASPTTIPVEVGDEPARPEAPPPEEPFPEVPR
jgi:outer membrane protein OmpA-like peptidoglycan-associated protein